MNSLYEENLARVLGEVFEGLAFMFSFPLEEGEDLHSSPATTARVSFSGDWSGHMMLRMSDDLLPPLAANMLGLSEDDAGVDLSQQQDALRELVNVLCGAVLPDIAGAEAVFDLSAPEIAAGSADAADGPNLAGVARLAVDDGYAEVALYVEDGILAAKSRDELANTGRQA